MITIKGKDDNIMDGNQEFGIQLVSIRSMDSLYHGLKPKDNLFPSLNNHNDDFGSFVLAPLGGITTKEGETTPISIRLTPRGGGIGYCKSG